MPRAEASSKEAVPVDCHLPQFACDRPDWAVDVEAEPELASKTRGCMTGSSLCCDNTLQDLLPHNMAVSLQILTGVRDKPSACGAPAGSMLPKTKSWQRVGSLSSQ